MTYRLRTNRHGVPAKGGPRGGPRGHGNVWDFWTTGQGDTRLPGPATCYCGDCGAVWPEGWDGEIPECKGTNL